jgi:hypothetical protein
MAETRSLSIHISSTGPVVQLNYDRLRQLGPNSLFVQAVEAEPDLTELKLDHSSLTQAVMTSLQCLCEGQTPLTLQGLAEAGHYLNMPLLEFLGSESYPQVVPFLQGKDLLNPEKDYPYLLLMAAKNGLDSLALYLLSRVEPETPLPIEVQVEYLSYVRVPRTLADIEGKALIYAVIRQNLSLVKRLLQRKVNVETAAIEAWDDRETCAQYGINRGEEWQMHQSLILAAWFGYTGILGELLSHPTCQNSLNPEVLCKAVQVQSVDCVRMVLERQFKIQHPSETEQILYRALRDAIGLRSLGIVELLLKDSRQTRDWDDWTVVPAVIPISGLDIVDLLLADPKCKTINIEAVQDVIIRGDVEMLRHLHAKFHFDPKILLDAIAHTHNEAMIDYILSLPECIPFYTEIFPRLCRRSDVARRFLKEPTFNPQSMFNMVIRGGIPEVLQMFLQDPRVDPSVDHNIAFLLAVQSGLVDLLQSGLVDLLLADSRVDPTDYDLRDDREAEECHDSEEQWHTLDDKYRQAALRLAVMDYNAPMVQRLMQDPRIDPTHNNYEALELAAKTSQGVILEMLLADPRVKLEPERIAQFRTLAAR